MLGGLARVIGGVLVTVMVWASWLVGICAVMAVSLYLTRLVPLAGKRKP